MINEAACRLAWAIAWVYLLPVICFGQSPTNRAKQPDKWALLISVDDYLNASDLKYCGADQQILEEQLIQSGFDKRQIYRLYDKAADRKMIPFKSNIERQLQVVTDFAEEGDLLVVGFSGHGVFINRESYLCPMDANLDDPNTLVSLKWLYDKLSHCKADLRLVLVDACRNDPRPEGKRTLNAKQIREGTRQFIEASSNKVPQGIVVYHSCAEQELAQEDSKLGHGVFMHFVVEGLSGKADSNNDKVVTVGEMVTYSSKETKLFVENKYNDIQRPKLRGDIEGDVLNYGLGRVGPSQQTVEKLITNSVGMKLVLIPAGSFQMGSNETKAELEAAGIVVPEGFDVSDESPRHRVQISQPFYMGQHEVTRGQFGRFVSATGYKTEAEKDGKGGWGYNAETIFNKQKPEYNWRSTGFQQSDDHPVVNVSWNDAVAFCKWLSQEESRPYRLPTEAEWEYACRGGAQTRYSTEDTPSSLAGYGNFQDKAFEKKFPKMDYQKFPSFKFDDRNSFTAPVGSFKANRFGLYDMHGNVWEWCSDWYDGKYYSNTESVDPAGPFLPGSDRVGRGGSWGSTPVDCRSAYRYGDTPDYRDYFLGFRLVLTERGK